MIRHKSRVMRPPALLSRACHRLVAAGVLLAPLLLFGSTDAASAQQDTQKIEFTIEIRNKVNARAIIAIKQGSRKVGWYDEGKKVYTVRLNRSNLNYPILIYLSNKSDYLRIYFRPSANGEPYSLIGNWPDYCRDENLGTTLDQMIADDPLEALFMLHYLKSPCAVLFSTNKKVTTSFRKVEATTHGDQRWGFFYSNS